MHTVKAYIFLFVLFVNINAEEKHALEKGIAGTMPPKSIYVIDQSKLDDPKNVFRFTTEEKIPKKLQGRWNRGISYDTKVIVNESIKDLMPGLYSHEKTRSIIFIRNGNSNEDIAMSLIGIMSYPHLPKEKMIEYAMTSKSLTPESLPILYWRLIDKFPWPWKEHFGYFGGIASLLKRYNPSDDGFNFNIEKKSYTDSLKRPILISKGKNDAPTDVPKYLNRDKKAEKQYKIMIGDLIASVNNNVSISGILTKDNGIIGVLDPDDLILSTQAPQGSRTITANVYKAGKLFGQSPIHCYTRDRKKAESFLKKIKKNPIYGLSQQRQYMILAGMIILIITLIRYGRKIKEKQKNKIQ